MNYPATCLLLLTIATLPLQAELNSPPSDSAIQREAFGSISSMALLAQHPKFASEYARFQPSEQDMAQIQSLQDLTLVVLFGSWCHDSEREVPRLLKLVQQSGVALSGLQLEAVNQQKQHPKQLHSQYKLRYTATIVVLDNTGQELGRIIEKPTSTLAADLAVIAAKR